MLRPMPEHHFLAPRRGARSIATGFNPWKDVGQRSVQGCPVLKSQALGVRGKGLYQKISVPRSSSGRTGRVHRVATGSSLRKGGPKRPAVVLHDLVSPGLCCVCGFASFIYVVCIYSSRQFVVLADGKTMFLTRSTASVSHRPYGGCKITALYFYKGVLTGSEKIFLRLAMVTSVVKNLTLTDRIPQPLYCARFSLLVVTAPRSWMFIRKSPSPGAPADAR